MPPPSLRLRYLSFLLTVIFPCVATLSAQADQARDAEWPLKAFQAEGRVWRHSDGINVIVAVIDSGVRRTHEDLAGQVLDGADFTRRPLSAVAVDHDHHGHGTGISSLIAGHGHGPDRSEGIEGLAPKAEILPLAISTTSDAISEAAEAIDFAISRHASVINMSFASSAGTPELKTAVANAISHDVVVVASSGNDGAAELAWPAAYPGVVSVGAVDADGKVWDQSNYGPGLTLTAPGVNIVAAGANSDSEYRLSDGTSDAAAYVSAEAALVRAEYPRLTAGQVVNRMIKSAVNPTGKVHDDHYGYGIIRPDAALTFDIPAGPPGGPLGQVGAVGAGSSAVAAGGGGRVVASGGVRRGDEVGVAAMSAAGGVAGVGVAGWMWWRRRKKVG
ncbi:subtilisin family serine protease [Streptacidiphilus sp. MAP12-33]|uniref:S8 family serine peptidase n=1 Tax=Streptacidiphilus sp. MAP12-33 TaxID=3156266 RepID=UPI003511B065